MKKHGISTPIIIGIIFIILKLTKVIDWSWLWVLAPFWLGITLAVFIITIIGVYAVLKVFFEHLLK